MNLSKLLLLATFIATPALPMIKMGSDNDIKISNYTGIVSLVVKGSHFSVVDNKVVYNSKSDGIATIIDQNYIKTVIECIQGNCTETRYSAAGSQIYPELPSSTPQSGSNMTILSFISTRPVLASIIAGTVAISVGYGLYRLSKAVQKPKKQ